MKFLSFEILVIIIFKNTKISIFEILKRIISANFYRGKVANNIGKSSGRYEDASGILRELPIDFIWTQEQSKFSYN